MYYNVYLLLNGEYYSIIGDIVGGIVKRVVFGIVCFMMGMISVFASEQYYISQRNTYYQRSQHTYSFNKSNGEYHDEYAVSIILF